MARPLRLEFAGALYHVTSRGNRSFIHTALTRPEIYKWCATYPLSYFTNKDTLLM